MNIINDILNFNIDGCQSKLVFPMSPFFSDMSNNFFFILKDKVYDFVILKF